MRQACRTAPMDTSCPTPWIRAVRGGRIWRHNASQLFAAALPSPEFGCKTSGTRPPRTCLTLGWTLRPCPNTCAIQGLRQLTMCMPTFFKVALDRLPLCWHRQSAALTVKSQVACNSEQHSSRSIDSRQHGDRLFEIGRTARMQSRAPWPTRLGRRLWPWFQWELTSPSPRLHRELVLVRQSMRGGFHAHLAEAR